MLINKNLMNVWKMITNNIFKKFDYLKNFQKLNNM